MAIGGEQIAEAIVVEIQKHGSPAHIRMGGVVQPGFSGHIVEHVTLIFIESVMVVGIRRDENVGLAIVVVVSDRQSHVGLLGSITAAGNAPRQRVFLEFPVTLVVVEVVEAGIVGHQDV